jgi:CCR4-NOT complex subunit CAF16
VAEPAIAVDGLTFRYHGRPEVVLDDVRLAIPRAARALVVGANGAGKTTLLRILGGKHMVDAATVRVLGASPFHDPALAARMDYLGPEFPLVIDLTVAELIVGLRGAAPARIARLVDVLGIDPGWHMHRVSSGQRRRVQLLLGLAHHRDVLLLDEVTTDLDLVARQDLLAMLRAESDAGATVVYASHILERLEEWATHLVHVVRGRIALAAPIGEVAELAAAGPPGDGARLSRLVEAWLRAARR